MLLEEAQVTYAGRRAGVFAAGGRRGVHKLFSPSMAESTFGWLCSQWCGWPYRADVWRFRVHAPRCKSQTQKNVRSETCWFSVLHWCALDMLNKVPPVLKLHRHSDRTFVDTSVRGFDALRDQFGSDGIIGLARQILVSFEAEFSRFYINNSAVRPGIGRWRLRNGLKLISTI